MRTPLVAAISGLGDRIGCDDLCLKVLLSQFVPDACVIRDATYADTVIRTCDHCGARINR